MIMLEYSTSPEILAMKEAILKDGQSIEVFCTLVAEYFNYTTVMLECAAKEDTECEKMITEILQQPHMKAFHKFISANMKYDIPF